MCRRNTLYMKNSLIQTMLIFYMTVVLSVVNEYIIFTWLLSVELEAACTKCPGSPVLSCILL